jgi:LacI family transcriptional regulator
MAVTIRSVAEEAGVSPATVSRVFNDTAPVEQSTRERILDAADRLGYVPNATARSLSTKKTNTFGVLLPYLTGEYFPEVIRGLDQAAQEHERFLLLSSSHHTPDDLRRALRSMYGRVDGLVLMLPQLAAADFKEYLPEDVPVVLLNCAPGEHDFHVLSIDNQEGGRMATRHLIEKGHERIGIITGGLANYEARERLGGYHAAMEEAGLPRKDEWIATADFSRESGKEAIRQLLEVEPRPTAVFASNDYMAMGAIHGLRDHGLSVPDDVAVVGFDDVPSAKNFTPSLSSVNARMGDLGEEAVSMLLALMDKTANETPARRVKQLDPLLRERASSGC